MSLITASPPSRRDVASRRGSRWFSPFVAPFTLALALGLSACGAKEPPPATASTPLASASAAPEPTAAPSAAPEPPAPVIHRSEIYASVVSRQGKVLKVLSLVATSETPPTAGSRVMLLRKANKG